MSIEVKYKEPTDRPVESVTMENADDGELMTIKRSVRVGKLYVKIADNSSSTTILVSKSDAIELVKALQNMVDGL